MTERKIDVLLNHEFKMGSITFKVVDLLFMLCLWLFALGLRIKLYPIESADYFGFLADWMAQIKSIGAWKSLGKEISNYTAPYMCLMSLVSGFDNSLYALKTISVIFDYIASIAIFLLVYELTHNTRKAVLSMAIVLLSPAVILDGAYWCQCDIIYCTFILYALVCFFKGKSVPCMVFLGAALAFKLQTVFILPFIIIMWLKKQKNISLLDLAYVPFVFIIFQLPAIFAGKPIADALLVYFKQASQYPWGTLEYPNIYALMDELIETNHHMYEVGPAGNYLAIILLGVVAYYIYTKNVSIDNNLTITIALFTVAIILYTMPHMHDRYGFLIDLLAIVYAVLRPKRLPIAAGFMLVSVLTYMPYLIAKHIFEIQTVAVGLGALIVFVGWDLYCQIQQNEIIEPISNQEAI